MGAFGDSISTAPSYADPLAQLLGVGYGEQAIGGYKTSDLLAFLKPAHIDPYTNSVLLCGINDVIQGVSAATIEANLTLLIAELNNPVVVCLLPFGNYASWDAGKEAVRVAVNTWIKANVATYVDAELVMGDGDGSQPVLLAEYDSGDGLHPNADGNTALAEAIFEQGFGSEALA
ncbi:MAG: GDSL-type esterase/lipase family protein [Dehalococcoidia bacterium]